MPYKLIGAFVLGCAIFFAGFQISNIRWERDFSEYQLKEKEKQENAKKEWESKIKDAESILVEVRKSESNSRAVNERLRNKINQLQRSAKDARSKQCVECEELGLECRKLLEEARGALRYSAGILNGK